MTYVHFLLYLILKVNVYSLSCKFLFLVYQLICFNVLIFFYYFFFFQISHHPPVCALHATHEKENIDVMFCQYFTPKFRGTPTYKITFLYIFTSRFFLFLFVT